MNILIAPDSFKGTMTSAEVIQIISHALGEQLPGAHIDSQPLSDGGEGFVTACCRTGCEIISVQVTGPQGRPVRAHYGRRGSTAIIEMAAAAGIELLGEHELNPETATTFGLGETIMHAIAAGCSTLYIGLGGSATHDAGMGMLRAMGAVFSQGKKEITTFRDVENIKSIDLNRIYQHTVSHNFICATDVTNPLLGEEGAAFTYARQKGASDSMISTLEHRTAIFADKLEAVTGSKARSLPGAGAAGGTAFGMFAALNATMEPGFEVVSRMSDLEARLAAADLIITGEGYLDHQSSFGKAPVRLLSRARNLGKPVIGVFGGIGKVSEPFDHVLSLTEAAGSREEAIQNPQIWLERISGELAALVSRL